jgi:hypothetical protein
LYTGFTKGKSKDRPSSPSFRGGEESKYIIDLSTNNIGLGCLMPISTIFELYRGSQFNWWRKPEYSEKTTDRSYVAEKHKQYIFPVE